jgi:thiamine-phosphate pyrophosphorylase
LLLYYITDRTQFPGNEGQRRKAVIAKIEEAARSGVDFIQLREKDLPTRELEDLAQQAGRAVRENAPRKPGTQEAATRLLINSRSDVAIACDLDGVHLRSDDISPRDARSIWAHAGRPGRPLIAVSCHSEQDVARAVSEQADLAVIAPIFEKEGVSSIGLDVLRSACRQAIPVIALGGITLENAADCVAAGAAGVAAIRLFQQNEIAKVVQQLRTC